MNEVIYQTTAIICGGRVNVVTQGTAEGYREIVIGIPREGDMNVDAGSSALTTNHQRKSRLLSREKNSKFRRYLRSSVLSSIRGCTPQPLSAKRVTLHMFARFFLLWHC